MADRKLKVYLDTSVVSYLKQNDAPEKTGITLNLWEKFKTDVYDIYLSDVTITEINKCNKEKLDFCNRKLSEIRFKNLEVTDEVFDLVNEIIVTGILTEKSIEDCQHIAVAVLNECDVIVSWNFKHLVNIKTIQGVRKITQLKGFKDIEIVNPITLLEMEE